MVLKAGQNTAVVLQPGKQAFDFPPPAVAAQRAASLGRGLFTVPLMGSDKFNATGGQPSIQGIAVIRAVSNQAVGPLGGQALCESRVDQGDFMRCSSRRVDGDRKTMAVCHRHELRTLAPLGRSHVPSFFFATIKVVSIKHSLRSNSPRVRKSSAKASSTLRRTPARTQCWNRR